MKFVTQTELCVENFVRLLVTPTICYLLSHMPRSTGAKTLRRCSGKNVKASAPASTGLVRIAGWAVILVGCVAFAAVGIHHENRSRFRDFRQPYASARCLLAHCDPYSEADTQAHYVAAGGVDDVERVFAPYSALYPPPALLLLTPLAVLSYPAAHAVWMFLLIVGISGAAFLMADLCSDYEMLVPAIGIAIFVWKSNEILILGQISGIAIALACVGLWAMLRGRIILAAICIACALCLKPHDVVFFLPYFLLAGASWRRALVAIMGITAAITLAGVLWCSETPASSHWLKELRADVGGSTAPGMANDPTPVNPKANEVMSLHAIFSVINRESSFYSTASYATTAVLFLLWLWAALRMENSKDKHLLSIAFLACLTMLPLYHRFYDTRLLLLVFPAIALLLAKRRWLGISALVIFSAQIFPKFGHLSGNLSQLNEMGTLHFLLTQRLMQLDLLALAVFFAVVLLRDSFVGSTKSAAA